MGIYSLISSHKIVLLSSPLHYIMHVNLAILLLIASVASVYSSHYGRTPTRRYSRGYSHELNPQIVYKVRSYPVVEHEVEHDIERGSDGRLYRVVEHSVERDVEHEYTPYLVYP